MLITYHHPDLDFLRTGALLQSVVQDDVHVRVKASEDPSDHTTAVEPH